MRRDARHDRLLTATPQLILSAGLPYIAPCGDNSGGTAVPRVVALFAYSLFFGLLTGLPVSAAEPASPPIQRGALEDSLLDAPTETATIAETEHMAPPALPGLRGLTSVALQSTGLLDYLSPFLTRETGIIVQWQAVSESRARDLARNCAGDVLLAAEPEYEMALVREGYAQARREVMSDGFALVGPQDDPAGLRGKDVLEALQAIADQGVPFVSRGDASGTARREHALWKKAERPVRDGKNGYVEIGQGTAAVLEIAEALGGYALVDEAAFRSYQAGRGSNLTVIIAAQPLLTRVWSLLPLTRGLCGGQPVTPAENNARSEEDRNTQMLADWWLLPSTQKRIAEFTREGQPLFTPVAPLTETTPGGRKAPARPTREKR